MAASVSIGFLDEVTSALLVPHTVIHVVTRRPDDCAELPESGDWIGDDGIAGGLHSPING
jgi:hypothetical protein